jgi:hypothetical protein
MKKRPQKQVHSSVKKYAWTWMFDIGKHDSSPTSAPRNHPLVEKFI